MTERAPSAKPSDTRGRRAAAIMFTDIEGFTGMTERLGDIEMHRRLMTHDVIVRSRLTAHNGRELKNLGDGFLVVFPAVLKALRCALAIQDDLSEHNARHDDHLKVRIGIHAGSVISKRDDVHGRNVIVASRIAELAKGGEILVSSVVRRLADGAEGVKFDNGRTAILPGLEGDQLIYALL